MFQITEDKTIHLTRGDAARINVTASHQGTDYLFKAGDVIRFKVFKRRDCGCVEIQKIVVVEEDTVEVVVELSGEETKIGDVINKPANYWYEIELNPDTFPQTIVGYDDEGEKIFRLYPEGSEAL